jgi:hypothetical protein
MDVKSSELLAALTLVSGVLVALPPLTESAGVDVDEELVPKPAFFFAAFSARRFCFEAEGGMVQVKLTID